MPASDVHSKRIPLTVAIRWDRPGVTRAGRPSSYTVIVVRSVLRALSS